ncbi:response regulator [Ornithinibacillus massiliensis]|uniref:Response regulator n=1 Tax=Ornithinibacillus massiliensis TaxID=1944633 RepID=A0ABS5MEE9_9BACI|nr:response regulator [Ornithinibacillus massiliensis]MBS3680706.1 response regulator [Ornithinibacillus massiliensis]
MMQLLIVDDEQIEREGMKAILQKSFPSLVINEARNGKMAIEKAKVLKPNLILMDIKMPGINGLEAMETIMIDSPDTKFIMVTAYDTFDYMRKAITLGASDYLLKPSKAVDIIEIVGKVLKDIVQEQKAKAESELQKIVFQKTRSIIETDLVTQLLFEHVHEVNRTILMDILDIDMEQEVFVMNVLMPESSEKLYALVKEKTQESGYCLVGAWSGNQLPIIVCRNHHVSFRSQAIALARKILSVTNQKEEMGWFIGIGNVITSLDQARQSYQESLVAVMDYLSPGKYRFYAEIETGEEEVFDQRLNQLKKQLPDYVKLGQWEEIRNEFINLIHFFEQKGASLVYSQQRMLEVLWLVSRVLQDLRIETKSPLYAFQTMDYRQLRTETNLLLEQLQASHVQHYHQLEADNVQQIKQYITEHSHEEISLEAIGKEIGLSPIYISKLFKEKMGINYIDFLTECRIEKAKKLMQDPKRSIKEIAIEVGYHEPNYFSKVFKKIVHVSPKEYQNAILGK